MPGRNPPSAVRAFVDPIQRAATQVIDTAIYQFRALPVERNAKLTVGTGLKATFRGPNPTPFRDRPDVTLHAVLDLEIIEDTGANRADERFRLTTRQYIYKLTAKDKGTFGWHWHPEVEDGQPAAATVPHVHVYDTPQERLHIPTGRVTIEDVFLFAVQEFGVKTRDTDGIAAIEATRGRHVDHRSWHNRAP